MVEAIRPIGGTAYKVKEPVENVFVDKQSRDLIVGQRNQSSRSRASLFVGKVVERVPAADYFDYNVWIDAEFPHVTFIAGKRGSGKSYDLGIILEGLGATTGNFSLVPSGFASVLFDLQSQFWALGEGLRADIRSDGDQAEALRKWNVVGKVRSPKVFLPAGSAPVTGTETPLVVPPRTLELSDWLSLVGCSRFDPMGQLLAVALQLTVGNRADFAIPDILAVLSRPAQFPDLQGFQTSTIDGLQWRLDALNRTRLFQLGANPAEALLVSDQCSIILMRELPEELKAVLVAVVMRQIERTMSRHHQSRKIALRLSGADHSLLPNRVWVMIDEAHLVCPAGNATAANPVIVDYVKRGRDAGLSLVLATQQPSAIDTAAISQVDLTILHKLTIDADIAAATARLPSPMPSSIRVREKDISDPKSLVRELLPGEALLSDAEASRTFLIRMRPRLCPHGGGEPLL